MEDQETIHNFPSYQEEIWIITTTAPPQKVLRPPPKLTVKVKKLFEMVDIKNKMPR